MHYTNKQLDSMTAAICEVVGDRDLMPLAETLLRYAIVRLDRADTPTRLSYMERTYVRQYHRAALFVELARNAPQYIPDADLEDALTAMFAKAFELILESPGLRHAPDCDSYNGTGGKACTCTLAVQLRDHSY